MNVKHEVVTMRKTHWKFLGSIFTDNKRKGIRAKHAEVNTSHHIVKHPNFHNSNLQSGSDAG